MNGGTSKTFIYCLLTTGKTKYQQDIIKQQQQTTVDTVTGFPKISVYRQCLEHTEFAPVITKQDGLPQRGTRWKNYTVTNTTM